MRQRGFAYISGHAKQKNKPRKNVVIDGKELTIASKNQNTISVIVWNYHDDDIAGASSTVELIVNGIRSSKMLVRHYRVDDQFSNSFEKWKIMGRPKQVTNGQYIELERAGQLQLYALPEWKNIDNEKAILKFDLPRQGVSLIQLSW